MIAVQDDDDDRAGPLRRSDNRAVNGAQRREQARDADRKAGRGNLFAAKPRDKPVVPAAAADRAEADRLAVLAGRFEGQLGFEDGAGVIFEASDDGGVDYDP